MGYSLHIERANKPISLTEWTAAVSKVPGVKLESSDIQAQKPTTGAVISFGGNPGNAAVLFNAGGSESWETCLFFGKRSISFAATEDIESSSNPVHVAVAALAKAFAAQIVATKARSTSGNAFQQAAHVRNLRLPDSQNLSAFARDIAAALGCLHA
jgi:hypothetical protein